MRTRACLGLLGPVLLAGIFLSSAIAEKKMPAMRKVGDKILREGMELDHEQEEALPDTSGEMPWCRHEAANMSVAGPQSSAFAVYGALVLSACRISLTGGLGRSENDEGNEVRRLPG